jgi:hypothetical protein
MSRRVFYEVKWSEIEAGDVVLVAVEQLGGVVKVEVSKCLIGKREDGHVCVLIECEIGGLRWRERFDPNALAYMQSPL